MILEIGTSDVWWLIRDNWFFERQSRLSDSHKRCGIFINNRFEQWKTISSDFGWYNSYLSNPGLLLLCRFWSCGGFHFILPSPEVSSQACPSLFPSSKIPLCISPFHWKIQGAIHEGFWPHEWELHFQKRRRVAWHFQTWGRKFPSLDLQPWTHSCLFRGCSWLGSFQLHPLMIEYRFPFQLSLFRTNSRYL